MITNELRQILNDACSALNKHKVEYLIIGGVAVASYGYYRISSIDPGYPEIEHDIDFWYNPTTTNFYNLLKALKEIGIDTTRLENIVFDKNKTYLRIPQKRYKMEFLPQIKGLGAFSESFKKAKIIHLDGNDINVIGYDDLITNKKAVDRKDIDALDKLQKKKNK